MIEVFGLLEHVFAKHAFVEAGGSNRADMLKTTGSQFIGQRHRVAGTFYIGRHLLVSIGPQVIDRRQVEKMIDGSRQGFQILIRNAKLGGPHVAKYRNRT